MKTILRNKLLIIMIFVLCLFVVGCGGEPEGPKSNYNEANYTLYGEVENKDSYTVADIKKLDFKCLAAFIDPIRKDVNASLEETKKALDDAANFLATTKSYSYTQTIHGIYDSEYNYQGVTKIDVTGETPMASIELSGTNTFAFYVANNKAYFNYDGYKTSYDIESDLSNIIEETESSIGAFSSFDSESITSENLVYAGVDKDLSTIIKYNIEEGTFAVIVISEGKIMKVMYSNSDGQEYIANYDYNKVTVVLPSDLSDYSVK